MRVLLRGYYLLNRPDMAVLDIHFMRRGGGYEVRLGSLPVMAIEERPKGVYAIRTLPGSPQLAIEFVNVHAAVCAAEHLIQTGGSGDWITWSAEVADPEHPAVRIKLA